MNKDELLKIYLKNDGLPRNVVQLATSLGFKVNFISYRDGEIKEGRPLAFTVVSRKEKVFNIYNDFNNYTQLFMLSYQIAEYLLTRKKYYVSANNSNTLDPQVKELAIRIFNRHRLYKNYDQSNNNFGDLASSGTQSKSL